MIDRSMHLLRRLRGGLDERTRTMPPARRLRFNMTLASVERLVPREPAAILDAGAGEGLLARRLARRTPAWSLIAADLDEVMLDRGAARARSEALHNVRFTVADVTKDLGTARFDAVLAIECLLEIPDDRAAVRAMAESLRAGGVLIAHVPTEDWEPVLPGSERRWRHEVRRGYSASQMAEMLSSAGLDVIRISGTSRGTVRVGQEIADRLKHARLGWRVAVAPLLLATVVLEERGVTWGAARALFVEARRRSPAAAASS